MTELMPVAVLQARMTQASRKGMTYLRRRSESLTLRRPMAWTSQASRVSSISCNSMAACSGERERSSAARAFSERPRRNRASGATRSP